MPEIQDESIRILMVEDLETDAQRTMYQFKRAGVKCDFMRVETAPALTSALEDFEPTLIISDFSLPQFDGLSALQICRERAPRIPFMFLSGTIGEERAIAALQAGACDYVLKDNLARLVPAARRAIGEAQVRSERVQQEARIERLNRLLRMMKVVNEVSLRSGDRVELLGETCRLATSVGSYSIAAAIGRLQDDGAFKVVATGGLDQEGVHRLEGYIDECNGLPSSAIASVFRSGREIVCNEREGETGSLGDRLMKLTQQRPAVVLPLVVDGETCGVLLLATRHSAEVEQEELALLRDLSRSLSFGLQYLNRDIRARLLSHFDAQTGLARRALFCDRVRDILLAEGARAGGHAVVLADVRRLSAINDSFGRHASDLLLRQIADFLKRTFPRQEVVGHFGGGTFALLMKLDVPTDAAVQAQILQQLHGLMGRAFQVEGRSIPVSLRLACARCPEDGTEAMTLVQNAETALQIARSTGQAYSRFDPAMHSQSVGQLALEHRLRQAVERREFELHYQPKVNVLTRRIHGAEALLRWRSPEDGLMPPNAFLPVLESSGLIVDVGNWVVEQASRDCQAWLAAGLPPLRVAVNVSPTQLLRPDFEEHMLSAILPWSQPHSGLDVEITEGVLQDDCLAEIKKLERLRSAGIHIAIDDFGTGYSSLSRLSSLPIDTLKIDRRFVNQMVHNRTGASVVKTVVELARAFGMTSVAEGVEKPEQLDLLWQMSCDQSQGFLHSPALPAYDFAQLLARSNGTMAQPRRSAQGVAEAVTH